MTREKLKKVVNTVVGRAFVERFKIIQRRAHQTAVEKGWWDFDAGEGPFFANCHAELSEAWEGIRKHKADEHCPEFSSVEVELADVIIRIMDTAEKRNWRVAEAIIAKMEFNRTRAYRHGGKKF